MLNTNGMLTRYLRVNIMLDSMITGIRLVMENGTKKTQNGKGNEIIKSVPIIFSEIGYGPEAIEEIIKRAYEEFKKHQIPISCLELEVYENDIL